MMSSLFISFDPSSWLLVSWNWLIAVVVLFVWPMIYFNHSYPLMKFFQIFMNILFSEFSKNMEKHQLSGSLWFLISLFLFLLWINILGLFPFIFTASSHLVFTMWFSLSLWFSCIIYSLFNNFYYFLSHLTPNGSPSYLAPFMVLIESVSVLIRPVTLAVRLAANMIAGHLLLILLGTSFLGTSWLYWFIIFLPQFLLLGLELAVAFIQAYVFTLLILLYSLET